MRGSLLRGAGAGAVAGLAAGLLLLGLRAAAGVPMVGELLADRFLPLLPVDTFLALLGRLGGPLVAREMAFAGSVAGPALLGVAAGAAFARPGAPRRRLAIASLALAAVVIAVAWPALDASYAGLPPGWARSPTIASIAAATAPAPWTPPARGRRTLVVRAYDGTGTVQESVAHGFAPAGATGLHSVEVIVA